MKRTQSSYIFDPDVNSGKMVFLFGPRQVGKTTLALNRLQEKGCEELYFNWDDPYVRKEYRRNPHFLKAYLVKSGRSRPMVVFDEIHKHKQWKNMLKGMYDIYKDDATFMITGSARLDYFRQSGDSLVGRYFSYRLLPLGLSEAAGRFDFVLKDDSGLTAADNKLLSIIQRMDEKVFKKPFERLMKFGGFPEPFLKADEKFSFKWRKDYRSLLLYEDLRELSRIQDVKGIEQLLLMLPERVGSPLSVNGVREDLEVNHKTAVNWLEALKKIYLVFSIMPWTKSISRAIRKEHKVYFFDWTMVEDEGARFENAVAVFLMRMVERWNEMGIGDFALRYLRTREGKEVDFLVVKNQRPMVLFEAKSSESNISKHGVYFSKALKVPYFQLVMRNDIVEAYPENRYVISAWRFLGLLG